MLQSIITQFLSGFSVVAILVIAAFGLAIIFGVAGVINMAHGELIMVGAYTAAVVGKLGGNTFIAIPVAFIVVGLLGLIIERGIIQWIYDRPLETLLATWGVGIILQVVIKLIFGPELYYVGAPKILEGGFRVIGRLPFPWYRLFLIVMAHPAVGPGLLRDFQDRFRTEGPGRPPQPGDLGLPRHRHRPDRHDDFRLWLGSCRYRRGGAGADQVRLDRPWAFRTRSIPTWCSCSAASAVCGACLTGGALIGEAETILSFIFNNVIGRLLVFLFIVIIIRIVPRGIFGYYERR